MLQEQSETNEDELNNARSKTSRHFRNKRKEYLKDKINELKVNSKKVKVTL
jgi:hypothetical protein